MSQRVIRDGDIVLQLREEVKRLRTAGRKFQKVAKRPDRHPLAAAARGRALEQDRRRQLLRAAHLLLEAADGIEAGLLSETET